MAWTVPALPEARRVVLEARLSENGRAIGNRWDLWLFPRENPLPPGTAVHGPAEHTWLREWREIPVLRPGGLSAAGSPILTERLDRELADFMRAGGRVVLAAGEGLVRPHNPLFGFVKYFFTPPANYAPYEDGQNGTVIARHAMLGGMPHDGFADWQFFRMIENAPPLDLEPLGLAAGDPVIRVIHRYPVLHPLGYLVERRVGRGGLAICALDLRPGFVEAGFLLAAVCRHAASDRFRPARSLSKAALERIVEACALP